jgi:hypothetical protein
VFGTSGGFRVNPLWGAAAVAATERREGGTTVEKKGLTQRRKDAKERTDDYTEESGQKDDGRKSTRGEFCPTPEGNQENDRKITDRNITAPEF